MSKITFRADDDLVAQLEELDASKSEVMREALRVFLEDEDQSDASERTTETAIDDLVRARVDELFTERIDGRRVDHRRSAAQPQDVNVTISLEGGQLRSDDRAETRVSTAEPDAEAGRQRTYEREPSDDAACGQCGERVDAEHVYCPNCGEKASRRLFCECGDEVRSDWSFCPSCGRRTPAADVLDSGQPT